jgi:hypothetical protein
VTPQRTRPSGPPKDIATARCELPARRPCWRSTDACHSRLSSPRGYSQAAARRLAATAGDDTIHSVHIPRDTLMAAIHVYGRLRQPTAQSVGTRVARRATIRSRRARQQFADAHAAWAAGDGAWSRQIRSGRRRSFARDDQDTNQMVTGPSQRRHRTHFSLGWAMPSEVNRPVAPCHDSEVPSPAAANSATDATTQPGLVPRDRRRLQPRPNRRPRQRRHRLTAPESPPASAPDPASQPTTTTAAALRSSLSAAC